MCTTYFTVTEITAVYRNGRTFVSQLWEDNISGTDDTCGVDESVKDESFKELHIDVSTAGRYCRSLLQVVTAALIALSV